MFSTNQNGVTLPARQAYSHFRLARQAQSQLTHLLANPVNESLSRIEILVGDLWALLGGRSDFVLFRLNHRPSVLGIADYWYDQTIEQGS